MNFDHVIAQDQGDMEYILRKLKDRYEKWGLEISFEKTKEVCTIDDKYIKAESKCHYLGTVITKKETHEEEIKQRISK